MSLCQSWLGRARSKKRGAPPTAPCWPGKRKHRNRGACKDGVTTCQQNNEFKLAWGACVGYTGITPPTFEPDHPLHLLRVPHQPHLHELVGAVQIIRLFGPGSSRFAGSQGGVEQGGEH